MAKNQSLTLPEVLQEIRMSRAAFYRMRARGEAPKLSRLPNGQIRVHRRDLDAWWARCEDRATA
ncbi:helix-turn-helix transcriptional regulator [Streptomyces cacaoi]|uniref:helix-turn-helix transcriptional regulator n=1 Tax=Streptomyces cacaoi TaxID=1898 RepID=UPI002627BF7D|nr:helix-turn-helix domain-containing protein [Streptomyces cacaoi]